MKPAERHVLHQAQADQDGNDDWRNELAIDHVRLPRNPSPFCGGLRHGIDRGDAFPSSTIYDGAFTSSAEADAQSGLGQR
jgi:hypothetical protein